MAAAATLGTGSPQVVLPAAAGTGTVDAASYGMHWSKAKLQLEVPAMGAEERYGASDGHGSEKPSLVSRGPPLLSSVYRATLYTIAIHHRS